MNNLTDSPLASEGDWKINPAPSSAAGNLSSSTSGDPPSVATNLLQGVVQGAHESIDRFAGSITPTVQSLEENLSDATNLVRAKTAQLRETRSEWVGGLRGQVRDHPMIAMAAALALGAAIGRITR